MKNLLRLSKYILLCTIISAGIISCSDNNDVEEAVLPSEIKITQVSTQLNIGDTQQLSATILPESTTDKSVIWLSSDDEIATVDADGLVTCISDGEVVIQAATTNNIKATTHLTVAEPDFIIPEELVGYWVGVEFNLKEHGTAVILTEDDIRESFKGLAEEYINNWLETERNRYKYFANGDATMECDLDVLMEDNTIERTVVYGVLSNMKNIEDAYYATFDVTELVPENPQFIQEVYVENGRLKISVPWNKDFDAIIYYTVVDESSHKAISSTRNISNSELNQLIPVKFQRNK